MVPTLGETKLKTIDISINKARLTSFTVTLPEDPNNIPDITATIGLVNRNGKQIAQFSLIADDYRRKYSKDTCLDIPVDALYPLRQIVDMLEEVVVAKCQGTFRELSASNAVVAEASVVED